MAFPWPHLCPGFMQSPHFLWAQSSEGGVSLLSWAEPVVLPRAGNRYNPTGVTGAAAMLERRPHARSFTCVTSLTKILAQMVKLRLRATLPKLAEVTQLRSELESLWLHSAEDRWLTFPVKTSKSETPVPSASNTLPHHSGPDSKSSLLVYGLASAL